MRVLYVAHESEEGTQLNIPAEVTNLKSVFAAVPKDLVLHANAKAEGLPVTLFEERYDILHLTAHGEGDVFQTLSEDGVVKTSPAQLAAFFNESKPFSLVYLNVCDSQQIGDALTASWPERGVPFAISTTTVISAAVGMAGETIFYTMLLSGASLYKAHQAAHSIVQSLTYKQVGLKLSPAPGQDPKQTYFSPQIFARMTRAYRRDDEDIEVTFGIKGAPAATTQIVFFTEDGGVVEDEDVALGNQLCQVTRSARNTRNLMWCDEVEAWDLSGDFTVHAIGVTKDAGQWTAKPTQLIEALRRWYDSSHVEGGDKPSGKHWKNVIDLLTNE